MADVTNAADIRFVNEVLRPLTETLRAANVACEQALIQWYAGKNASIGSSAEDAILDGREAEGVSRLTAADVTSAMGQAQTFATQMDGAGVADVIQKPCVRTLMVS